MKHIIVLLTLIFSLSIWAQDNLFRVMTYNIRYAGDEKEDGENAWSKRKEMVAKMVRFNKADILGTQEGLHSQLVDLNNLLKNFNWIGVAREDGKEQGEYSAIFFNKKRFEKLEASDFWLSETPGKPSKGWNAAYERIATWGKFKDKKSGKTFFVFNTHFDHLGEKAREE